MAEGTTDDPGGTADATTEGEDMVEYANRDYVGRGYDDMDRDYPRTREESPGDREPRGRGTPGGRLGTDRT